MTNRTTKTIAPTVLAALGLGNLSLAQLLAAGAMLSAATVATPALASLGIPGVGLIIKSDCAYPPRPCKRQLIAPTDSNGVVRMTGLEPGSYEVSLIGGSRPITILVGRDGMLTTQAQTSDDGKERWVDNMAGKPLRAVAFDARALFSFEALTLPSASPGRHPADPMSPGARLIDVNASSAADIVRLAPTTSAEAADFIVGERTKNGAYKDLIDFAQRTCPKVSVDFDLTPTRIGNALIIARGGDPKSNGFKCAPASRGEEATLELYGKKHSYIGHVTLLR